MLITVPVEELRSGDVLQPDSDETTLDMVRDAMNVPTRTERTNTFLKLQQQAKRVERIHSIGRIYAHITMGTYAVVSRRKGTLVSVDRPEPNGPQRGSGDVAEANPQHDAACSVYYSDDVTGEPYDCDCGAEPPRPEPFSYVRSQFNHVEDSSEFYRLQVRSNNRGAHTKWMNVSPEQFRAIREILAEGES